jgi:hypothetical protein
MSWKRIWVGGEGTLLLIISPSTLLCAMLRAQSPVHCTILVVVRPSTRASIQSSLYCVPLNRLIRHKVVGLVAACREYRTLWRTLRSGIGYSGGDAVPIPVVVEDNHGSLCGGKDGRVGLVWKHMNYIRL